MSLSKPFLLCPPLKALKYWAVLNVDELCNDVIVLDSDILWIKDFDVRDPVPEPRLPAVQGSGGVDPEEALSQRPLPGCPRPPPRYKYCLSSQTSGAWYDDITK